MATEMRSWQKRCERMERIVIAEHARELREQAERKPEPRRKEPRASAVRVSGPRATASPSEAAA
jgi:hypothetical protein